MYAVKIMNHMFSRPNSSKQQSNSLYIHVVHSYSSDGLLDAYNFQFLCFTYSVSFVTGAEIQSQAIGYNSISQCISFIHLGTGFLEGQFRYFRLHNFNRQALPDA